MKRVVVVTGAASGIGLAIAERFACAGHHVAMLDVLQDQLSREASRLQAAGWTVRDYVVDVCDRSQINAAYDDIRNVLGPVTIAIANAGISGPHPFETMPAALWQRMLDINLTGTFNTLQPAIPDMLEAGWGRIVTISSHAGQQGAPNRSHYAAAKAGVIGLTKSLAKEYARRGITVNTVPPSLVDTPLARGEAAAGTNAAVERIAEYVPVGRAGTPDDIAAAVMFICSDEASYITGQQINVNGGMYM